LNLIIGFLKPLSGKVYLNNKILSSKDVFDWQQTIAYMPQKTCLTDDTVLNNIRLDSKIDNEKLFKCLKESELIKDIKSNKIFLNRKIGEDGVNLSEGQRQRLSLARALYYDRQILILDEATSSLDNINERNILKTLSKLKNKTIIMVTHNKNNLSFFDKVFEIKNNKFSKV
jgi:ABC-type bacteriocin/lantibiotic exporter with double-glycine peptidase domain